MGIFKKKVVKKIEDGVWGHLVNVHQVNVDILFNEMRCVEREGVLNGGELVKYLRVFKPAEAQEKGIEVTGWATFDEHPDLIHFEGYLTKTNKAHLERKKE